MMLGSHMEQESFEALPSFEGDFNLSGDGSMQYE
jgi:hypothetical protein